MKTVTLSCPHCQAENSYTVDGLKAAAGQAQCAQCGKTFSVLRKKQPAPAPQETAAPKQSAPETEAGNLLQAKIPLREKLARLKQQSDALAAQQDETPPPPKPPEAPAAEAGKTAAAKQTVPTVEAEVLPPKPSHAPDIQTLLQRSQANAAGDAQAFRLHQDPPVTTVQRHDNPAIEALLQRHQNAAPPPATLPSIDTLLKTVQQHTAGSSGNTQNIHIQAQSLVFNLVSGKDGLARLPQGTALPAVIDQNTDGGLPAEPPPPAAAAHQEFNWTLASLVALTVLIVQLFYYLLIMR